MEDFKIFEWRSCINCLFWQFGGWRRAVWFQLLKEIEERRDLERSFIARDQEALRQERANHQKKVDLDEQSHEARESRLRDSEQALSYERRQLSQSPKFIPLNYVISRLRINAYLHKGKYLRHFLFYGAWFRSMFMQHIFSLLEAYREKFQKNLITGI